MTYNFGDGTISEWPNTQHQYQKPAFYVISQAVTNAFGSTDMYKDVDFGPASPTAPPSSIVGAEFAVDYSEGDSPLTVHFYDLSWGNVKNYSWQFGDGSPASTEENPVHTFTTDNSRLWVFPVQLTVTDAYGAISQYTTDISVWGTYVPPTTIPTPTPTTIIPTTIPTGTVTGTPTSTVTTTPTGTQILPLIASPTGIIYSSYVLPVPGNGPDMSTVYQIYTTVTNPNNVAVPIDLTMTEDPVAPSPLLGEQYQANQPISADNTNVIQAYSSHTFTFSYIHKWDWTDTITGPFIGSVESITSQPSFILDMANALWQQSFFWNWDPTIVQYSTWFEQCTGLVDFLNKLTTILGGATWASGLTTPSEYTYTPHAMNVNGLTTLDVKINVGVIKTTAYAGSVASAYGSGDLTLLGTADIFSWRRSIRSIIYRRGNIV